MVVSGVSLSLDSAQGAKVMKRLSVVIFGALAALAFILILSIKAYQDNSKKLYEYAGLRIGQGRSEALYRWGLPREVYGPEQKALKGMPRDWDVFQKVYYVNPDDDDSAGHVNAMPQGKSPGDFDDWSYSAVGSFRSERLVHFVNGRVASIQCRDSEKTTSACVAVLGVKPGSSEEVLFKKLGHPTRENIDKSGTKIIYYDHLG